MYVKIIVSLLVESFSLEAPPDQILHIIKQLVPEELD